MKNLKIAVIAAVLMAALFVPAITASAASCGETVSQNTAAELQAIDYETDEIIGELLAPSR